MTEADQLAMARALVAALETNDRERSDQIIDDFSKINKTELFKEVGRLTRQLHDTLSGFAQESRLGALTSQEIPDAKERLHYVIAMTEQAANQTLNIVEALVPIADQVNQDANELATDWARFLERKMPFDEFKNMTRQLSDHFQESTQALQVMRDGLDEILMAQSFQDISGQVIRRVIGLVEEVENNLVDLIRAAGKAEIGKSESVEPELPGPVVPGLDDKKADVAQTQDDVDDLLSSLGF